MTNHEKNAAQTALIDFCLCAGFDPMISPIKINNVLIYVVVPVQVDQRVFKDLMSEKLPRLHAHFEQYKVDFSLITFNWFLVVFVDSVVSDILFKIWDAFLYEGPKVRVRGEGKTVISLILPTLISA